MFVRIAIGIARLALPPQLCPPGRFSVGGKR